MNSTLLSTQVGDDSELVSKSRSGSRDAFGRIVERYQSLVCALTFSQTGNVARSEDLAQETFLTAWRQLSALRDPAKLRAWLCGIARNVINADRRRHDREPAHQAATMEALVELQTGEKSPPAQAITNEEVALLWREVSQLPDIYREPLVLFYRQQKSVACVAGALELSEDAVMQRLSRGRKLLHERMLVFVETALDRTSPGKSFTLRVDASLTLLAVGSQVAGVTSAKGIALKGSGGGLFALALPFVGMLAALGLSWTSIRKAPNSKERRFAKIWNAVLWVSIGALLLAMRGVAALSEKYGWDIRTSLTANVAIWFSYLMVLVALLVIFYRRNEAAFDSRDMTHVRPVPATEGLVIATYVASSAWMIGLAWVLGDRGTAFVVLLLTMTIAISNLRRMRRLDGAAAHRLNGRCHAGLCAGLLVIVNFRLSHWVAPFYRVSAEEMHRLLPMTAIHLLTFALLGWAIMWLYLTGRRFRRER